MMRCRPWLMLLILSLLPAGSSLAAVPSADETALRDLLDAFLAGVEDVGMHERFWDDDLIYTSSNGTRTGKPAIIDSMREADDSAALAGPSYSAQDVDIRLLGDTAVVAFRLVANGPSAGEHSEYFNTGTFVRRAGGWRAIAWQATRIPIAADD